MLHGQVGFAWVPALDVNCLVVANDKVAKDEFQKMAMGLAKPPSVKLLILTVENAIAFLNDDKSKNAKILLIVNSINDAFAISKEVTDIQSINFGGIRTKNGAKLISKAIAVTDDEINIIRQMLENGLELEVRQVPTDKKQLVKSLL